jgi:hypothetical protein
MIQSESANAYLQGKDIAPSNTDIVFVGTHQIGEHGSKSNYLKVNEGESYLTVTAIDCIILFTTDIEQPRMSSIEPKNTVALIRSASSNEEDYSHVYFGGHSIIGVPGNHCAIRSELPPNSNGSRSMIHDLFVKGDFSPTTSEIPVDIPDKGTNIHLDISNVGISSVSKDADGNDIQAIVFLQSGRSLNGAFVTSSGCVTIHNSNFEVTVIKSGGPVTNSEVNCGERGHGPNQALRVHHGNLTLIEAMSVDNVKITGVYYNDPHEFIGVRSTDDIQTITADLGIKYFDNVLFAVSITGTIKDASITGVLKPIRSSIVMFTYGPNADVPMRCEDHTERDPNASYTFSQRSVVE